MEEFYPKTHLLKTKEINPDFLLWLKHVLPKLKDGAKEVCEKILNEKEIKNLSIQEHTILRTIFAEHTTKSNCNVCWSYFSWKQQITKINVAKYITIHAHCENDYKLRLLKKSNAQRISKLKERTNP